MKRLIKNEICKHLHENLRTKRLKKVQYEFEYTYFNLGQKRLKHQSNMKKERYVCLITIHKKTTEGRPAVLLCRLNRAMCRKCLYENILIGIYLQCYTLRTSDCMNSVICRGE